MEQKNLTIKLWGKIVSMMLICSLLISFATPPCGLAETQGKCGPNCSYTLSEDGTLTISGTGAITKIFADDTQMNEKIRKLIIEEGIEKIGEKCFERLWYQKIEVSLPSTLTEIGQSAFYACWIEEIEFPKNLKKIGDNAFQSSYLYAAILPDSLEEIGLYAFQGGDFLEEISLPDSMKKIPYAAFADCKKLKKIKWPQDLQIIDKYAFSNCGFDTFIIPDTVKEVAAGAFERMNLTSITVGKSVEKISKKFVSACYDLKEIINHSQISIPLDTMKGKRNWYVEGKKVTKLQPEKTATPLYRQYKIKYVLDGGKVIGEKPKTYTYRGKTQLPMKVKKKGYTFLGWFVYGDNDWECFPEYVPDKLYGKLTAEAILKKYKVESSNGRIKVSVQDKSYGTKAYKKDSDAYYFRYSENEDMSDSTVVVYTAPYGKGLSKKLKKGKTYYVEVTRYFDLYMEDSEDYEEPFCGWHCKRKITIQ